MEETVAALNLLHTRVEALEKALDSRGVPRVGWSLFGESDTTKQLKDLVARVTALEPKVDRLAANLTALDERGKKNSLVVFQTVEDMKRTMTGISLAVHDNRAMISALQNGDTMPQQAPSVPSMPRVAPPRAPVVPAAIPPGYVPADMDAPEAVVVPARAIAASGAELRSKSTGARATKGGRRQRAAWPG